MIAAPLAGRGEELAAIVDRLTALPTRPATRTWPQVAVVQADAGLGKSTLIAALINALNRQPDRLLIGPGRLHSQAPYDRFAAILCVHPDVAPLIAPHARPWLAPDAEIPVARHAPAALLRLALWAVRALVSTGPTLLGRSAG